MAALRALRTLRDRRLGRPPLYEDIKPSTSWADAANGRNLIISIPGFKKEEVNMEINESGNVTIKGRHDLSNNRFRRFSMTVSTPENTDMNGIIGNLEGELYTVVFPKIVVPEKMQETELGAAGREVEEGTKPEQKQLDDKTDEVLGAALETNTLKTMENVSDESSKETAVEKSETAEKVSAAKGTILTNTLRTDIPEAKKATKKPNAIATQEPETTTKAQETSADQELPTVSKPQEIITQEPETSEPMSENATTTVVTALDLPETNSLTEMPKAAEPSAPDSKKTIQQKEMVKYGTKNELQKDEEIIKEGRFLENVMEMITEHKVCIISAILAFSMGIIISRRISS